MYCINSEMWDNGCHLLTFYLLVEMFDLASAVLLGANALEAPISPPPPNLSSSTFFSCLSCPVERRNFDFLRGILELIVPSKALREKKEGVDAR